MVSYQNFKYGVPDLEIISVIVYISDKLIQNHTEQLFSVRNTSTDLGN